MDVDNLYEITWKLNGKENHFQASKNPRMTIIAILFIQ